MILVLNTGSSSIKFAVYDDERVCCRGQLSLTSSGVEGSVYDARSPRPDWLSALVDQAALNNAEAQDSDALAQYVLEWVNAQKLGWPISAVGHRVVHGGTHYSAPVMVTEPVMQALAALAPLAPLHQPHSLSAIRMASARWPGIAQVACFDTGFHATQPTVATTFALPRALTASGIRRYGFHGLSYEYIASQLPRVFGADASAGRVIMAHLGSGASLCAMAGGRSVATTTGFSALDGLMMGTRCGSLDPGVLLYLLESRGMSAAALTDLLYSQSGLLGVSGISSNMAVLLDSHAAPAKEAINLYVYRIVCEIGALAAALGGLDAIVFTAGIGAYSAPIRARVIAGCAWLGAALDETANQAGKLRIDSATSKVLIASVPTNEELMIARHTRALMAGVDVRLAPQALAH
jgi:acetate kinase